MTWSDCYLQRREVSALHQVFHPSPESKPCLSLFFMPSVSLPLTRQKIKWSVTFNNGITKNFVMTVLLIVRRLPSKIIIYMYTIHFMMLLKVNL